MLKIWTREEYEKIILNWDEKKIFYEDECPFCNSLEQDWHTIWKWKYRYILHNLFPYSWNEKHLMAVPYQHRAFSWELTGDEFLEIKDIQAFMKDYYKEENYFSCTRETMWNRSIEHYHMHFVPWRLQWKYLRKMLENQGFPIKEDLDINEKKYI